MLQKARECINHIQIWLWNNFFQAHATTKRTAICHTLGSDGLKVNEMIRWHRIISCVIGYNDNPVKFLESGAH